MMVATPELVRNHYTLDAGWFKATGEKSINAFIDKGMEPPTHNPIELAENVLGKLVTYMTSGPIIVMVWQGAHVVKIVRKIIGGTEPLTSDVGTIRGDYVLDSYELSSNDGRCVRNLVHASGSVSEANNEIKHWFTDNEIMDYKLIGDIVLYGV